MNILLPIRFLNCLSFNIKAYEVIMQICIMQKGITQICIIDLKISK